MTDAPHLPVMLAEVCSALAPRDGGIYVDGTFGAGGYSRALLAAADCKLYAIDRDPDAVATGRALEAEAPGRFTMLEGRFGDMADLLAAAGVHAVDGVVLDIGVSSMQLDTAARGFSFRFDGPLDMRMSQSGPSAADFVNSAEEAEIARVLWQYGEERASRKIARRIVAHRKTAPLTTTAELAELIRAVVRPARDGIDPATRSFQALRIYVNDELGELARALIAAESLLATAGRLVVVSFHSLEDRQVKTFLKARSHDPKRISRPLPGEVAPPPPSFQLLTRKAIAAGQAECTRNPRARSAKLRAAIRTDNPPVGTQHGERR